jgi:hypothetical protein
MDMCGKEFFLLNPDAAENKKSVETSVSTLSICD